MTQVTDDLGTEYYNSILKKKNIVVHQTHYLLLILLGYSTWIALLHGLWIFVFDYSLFIRIPLYIYTAHLFYKMVLVNYRKFYVNQKQIIYRNGIFIVDKLEINFHRIKAINVVKPWYYLFLNLWKLKVNVLTQDLGDIIIESSDPNIPLIIIKCIPNSDDLANAIREKTLSSRLKNKTNEIDLNYI